MPADDTPSIKPLHLLIKAGALFALLNLGFTLIDPLPELGNFSVYNTPIIPGRERLPFGESPDSYNLSLFNLQANLASHEANRPPTEDEFRVLIVGDSSVWGILLENDETLAGHINAADFTTPEGQRIRAYNLGYPTISVTKDLLLMQGMPERYQPDMVLWLTTLEALPRNKQLTSPIVQNNPIVMRELVETYNLPLDTAELEPATPLGQSLVTQRREMADIIRLNMYGVMWAATGIDQLITEDYTPRANDLAADDTFYDITQPLTVDDLALGVIEAGVTLWEDVPVVLINEPMFIANGENSDIRYNFYYPRWAYDDYRAMMTNEAGARGWRYLDLWNAVDNTEFTNSAIHLTPRGEEQLAAAITDELGWQAKQR